MTLKQFAAYFTAAVEGKVDDAFYYLRDWTFEHPCPDLLADFVTPALLHSWTESLPDEMRPSLRWIYIGVKGSGSALHVDTMHSSAWNGVIQGKKLWTFYPCARKDGVLTSDPADPAAVRPEEAIICIQNPGDLVYTPSGWLHKVDNLEAGISITENFVNAINHAAVRRYLVNENSMEHVFLLDQLSVAHLPG